MNEDLNLKEVDRLKKIVNDETNDFFFGFNKNKKKKEYYEKNKDKISKYYKNYYKNKKDKIKERRIKNEYQWELKFDNQYKGIIINKISGREAQEIDGIQKSAWSIPA